MRKILILLAGVLVLAVVNITIYQREQLIEHGRVVLLELAPVDPRSLMQGDYMALRYKLANDAFPRGEFKAGKDGHIVVAVDEHGVAGFKRLADDRPLAANEAFLRYRVRNEQPKFATNAFFFQEGHADRYQSARYGEFRVAQNGEMILTAMRGSDYAVLGKAK
ncbi:GDYXXLXY domain-containing protein [soil metagenome]